MALEVMVRIYISYSIIKQMSKKTLIWIGIFVGSTIGSYLPVLWGDAGFFSFSSIIFSTIGGLVGVYIGFKLGD